MIRSIIEDAAVTVQPLRILTDFAAGAKSWAKLLHAVCILPFAALPKTPSHAKMIAITPLNRRYPLWLLTELSWQTLSTS